MRIGFYTPNYPGVTGPGGIGTYTQALARSLASRGHEVHVLTPGSQKSCNDGQVRVHFARTKYFPVVDRVLPGAGACWRVTSALRQLVRHYSLQILEIANWEGYALGYIHVTRVPTVVRLATSSCETQEIDGAAPSRRLRWDIRRERWQAHAATALVTHSDAHRQRMASELGIPAERIGLIPLGVQDGQGFVRPARPAGPPTVVFLGRMEHRKGTLELLQAIPKVLNTFPNARFVMIGADRPHCPGGRTHAKYLCDEFPAAIQRQVVMTGPLPQEEVDQWLQTADLFVAPSRYESFGLIFLEAMRWGTPVVGTTAGGISEIVQDGKSGVLVPPEDPGALAQAVTRLLGDAGLRASLGSAGRERMEREFTIDVLAARSIALYEALIASRRSNLRKPALAMTASIN